MTERARRTRLGSELSELLVLNRLELQVCQVCKAVQYPPAEICRGCLRDELSFAPIEVRATVIASAIVHHSHRADFAVGGPWSIASVRLGSGAVAFAHILSPLACGENVELIALTDRLGDGVLGAISNESERAKLQAKFGEQQ